MHTPHSVMVFVVFPVVVDVLMFPVSCVLDTSHFVSALLSHRLLGSDPLRAEFWARLSVAMVDGKESGREVKLLEVARRVLRDVKEDKEEREESEFEEMSLLDQMEEGALERKKY